MQTVVDEELQRLPEALRSAVVLCYLEGKTRPEASRLLGWNKGTLHRRLEQARELLRSRLLARGLAPMAALTAALFAEESASATVPAALAGATIRTALRSTAVAPAVAALVEGGLSLVSVSKSKVATMILLALSLLGGVAACGLALSRKRPAQSPAAKADDKPRTAPPSKPEAAKSIEIRGRVLGPDGKPKAGAKLLLLGKDGKVEQRGVSTADGRFLVAVPKEVKGGSLIAQADETGIDFFGLSQLKPEKPIELRLVKDQAIRGRVVNTEGKPIAGMRVSVNSVNVYAHNSLESFLILWQKRPADHALPHGEKTVWFRIPSLLSTKTNADGRFVISGVGVERVAELDLHGGGIANTSLWVANRDGFDFKPYNWPADDAYRLAPKRMNPPPFGSMLQGPNVSLVAEPEKPIRGVVKDADSGKGVPNVPVRLEQSPTDTWRNFPVAKTDSQGRYEFHGARKTKTYPFYVDSDSTAGYLATQINAADTVGYSPLRVDIRIKKGVIVTGKIIDRATGNAVPGFAQFAVLAGNPFVEDFPPFHSGIVRKRDNTAADGAFRVVVIPGPVLLMGGYYPPPAEKFDYIDVSKYRPPIADPEHPEYFSKLPISRSRSVGYLSYRGGIGLIQGNCCKVLDIKPGTAVVHQDLLLERASVLEVKIQDADGRPVVGVWATDFATGSYIGPLWIERSTCPVYGLEARKPRQLIFYEPKKKIVGLRKLQGDEKPPLAVKLGAMATLKGRLLDADGKPLAGVAVRVNFRESEADKLHRLIHAAKQSITDATGAFAFEELIPEVKFELVFQRGNRRIEREAKDSETTIQVKPGGVLRFGRDQTETNIRIGCV